MSAPPDDAPRNASGKMRCYERVRARVLEARHAPVAVASAAVLVRQGMSAWMKLDDSQDIEPKISNEITQHRPHLPSPEHAELLAVLTGLVLDVCNQKESA